MEYTVKFGLLGKLLDSLMIRKQTEGGIKNSLMDSKRMQKNKFQLITKIKSK